MLTYTRGAIDNRVISKSYTRSDESHDLKTDLLQVTLAMMTHVRSQRQTDRIRSSRIIKLVNRETEHFLY